MMRFSSQILCVIFFVCTGAGDVGDSCRPTQDIADGQCVLVIDCEVAIRSILVSFTHPFRRCGFVHTFEVVCCPKRSNHTSATTTKTGITSSTSLSVDNSMLQTSPTTNVITNNVEEIIAFDRERTTTTLASHNIVGEPCVPTQNITKGECKLVSDCEIALRVIQEQEIHPFKRCGFRGMMEIICCPNLPVKLDDNAKKPPIIYRRSNSTSTMKIGDPCVPTQNITKGECKLVSDCEIALRVIQEQETHPFKRCGFRSMMEIICCPNLPVKLDDDAKKPPINNRRTTTPPSTSIVEVSKVFTTVTDNPFKNLTTVAPKDFTTIADKECKKIMEKTLPPVSLHIIGGTDAGLGEFPHMVALGYDSNNGIIAFKCGGTIISEKFVLTAAHCVHNPSRDIPSIVRMGVVHIGEGVFNSSTDVKIAEIIIHPKFKDPLKYHDLALIRLERPVDYSETLIPACLYTGEDIPDVALTITGWGKTNFNKDGGSKVLQKANVTAASQEECAASYSQWRKLPAGIARGQFCAGDSSASRDTCQGDSGGPLQGLTANDGYYRIIGITSFGRGCGGLVPGVYTQVSVYREWIESIVWHNEV